MAKLHEDLLRDVVRTIDTLNAHGVELAADVPAAFFHEHGRREMFRLTWRGDDDAGAGFYYEVTL